MRRSAIAICLLLVGARVALACGESASSPEDGIPLPDRGETDAGSDVATAPDTGGVDASDSGADRDAGTSLRVFATSRTTNGRMGGLAGADKICATRAVEAKLIGTFVAWLSADNGPHAADRVTGNGPWRLVSGEIVSETKSALLSGVLSHAIDHDENGVALTATKVWTGSGTDGRYLTNDCDKWTNGTNGRVGKSDEVGSAWTTSEADDCDALRRLYCFQVQ